ncbi:MAG: hypothetical protein AB8G11_25210 [Saprospiraceae bacterium]
METEFIFSILKICPVFLNHLNTTTIDTIQLSFNLRMFPNPMETEGMIVYELTKQSNINIFILNGLGQKVQVIKQNELEYAGKHYVPIIIQKIAK